MHTYLTLFIFFVIYLIPLHLLADNIAFQWNQVTLNLIRDTNTPAPIAARTLAIVHTCMFDAWAAYDKKAIGTRRGDSLRRPKKERTDVNRDKAISYAAFRALVDLFPHHESILMTFMNQLGYDASNQTTHPDKPAGIGNLTAHEVLHFRHFDGANQLGNELNSNGLPYSDYTGYKSVNFSSLLAHPDRWHPLEGQTFIVPHWGLVTPFALASGNEIVPTHPPMYPAKEFHLQTKTLLDLNAELNDDTKMIAEYWSNGQGTVTIAGHWNVIAQFISRRDHHKTDDDIKMFFVLNNALLDTSIATWNAKKLYDSIRPITAIRQMAAGKHIKAWAGPGQGIKSIKSDRWQPYLSTPPSPEYISEYSAFSSAAATVLELFTANEFYGNSVTIPQGSSFIEPGITPSIDVILCWPNFKDAAEQAGLATQIGGIHFEAATIQGNKIGQKIGTLVFTKASHFMKGIQLQER